MPAKKKILFIITKSVWGGAQRYVYDLAAALPKERFDVAVAAGGQGMLFDRLRRAGIRVMPIAGFDRDVRLTKEFRAFFGLLTTFLKEKPDIIHLNSTKAGVLGAVAALIYRMVTFSPGTRVIFTVHGWGFRENRGMLFSAALFFFSWFSSLLHHAVILLNKADLASARAFIPERKLAFIPLGIQPIPFLDFKQARIRLARRIDRPIENVFLVGAVAELTQNKGLLHLVDSLNLLSPLKKRTPHTLIIGDGEQRSLLDQRIRAQKLDQKVTLAGFIPDAEHYLSAFDCFILPSLKEGLPYAIMEAMAAGLPVIATNVGGIPDLIKHDYTGILIPPKNPEAIRGAIESLIRDPMKKRQLGRQAKKHADQNFQFAKMIEDTIHLYESRYISTGIKPRRNAWDLVAATPRQDRGVAKM